MGEREVKVRVTADMSSAQRAIDDYAKEAKKLEQELKKLGGTPVSRPPLAPPEDVHTGVPRPADTRRAGTTGVSGRRLTDEGREGSGGSFDNRDIGVGSMKHVQDTHSEMVKAMTAAAELIARGGKTRNQLSHTDHKSLQSSMGAFKGARHSYDDALIAAIKKREVDIAKLQVEMRKRRTDDAKQVYQQKLDDLIKQKEMLEQKLEDSETYEQKNIDMESQAGKITPTNSPTTPGGDALAKLGGFAAIIGILKMVYGELKASGQRAIQKEATIWDVVGRTGAWGDDTNRMRTGMQFSRDLGFTADQSAQVMDNYFRTAGFTDINSGRDMTRQAQEVEKGYGVDAGKFAQIGGTAAQRGLISNDAAGQRRFAAILVRSVESSKMVGREEEQLQVLQQLLPTAEEGRIGVSEDSYGSLLGLYSMIAGSNDLMRGEKGSSMVQQLDNAIRNGNEQVDRSLGWGTELYGLSGAVELERRKERGVSDPDNLKRILEYSENFGGAQGDAFEMFARNSLGLSGDQIDLIRQNEDLIKAGEYSIDLEKDTNMAINSLDRNVENYINSQLGKDRAAEIGAEEGKESLSDGLRNITRPFNEWKGGLNDQARGAMEIGVPVAGTIATTYVGYAAIKGSMAAASGGGSALGGALTGGGAAAGTIATTAAPIAGSLAMLQAFASPGLGPLDWFKSQDTTKQEQMDWLHKRGQQAQSMGIMPEHMQSALNSGLVDNIYQHLQDTYGFTQSQVSGARFATAEGMSAKDKIGGQSLSGTLTKEEQAALWMKQTDSTAVNGRLVRDNFSRQDEIQVAEVRQSMLDFYQSLEGQQQLQDAMLNFYKTNGKITEDFLISLMSMKHADNPDIMYRGHQGDMSEVFSQAFDSFDNKYSTPGTYSGRFADSSVNSWYKNYGQNDPTVPQHAIGDDYIPFDGYMASLHQGEAILDREEAKQWRAQRTTMRAVGSNASASGIPRQSSPSSPVQTNPAGVQSLGALSQQAASMSLGFQPDELRDLINMDEAIQELTTLNLSERDRVVQEERELLDRQIGRQTSSSGMQQGGLFSGVNRLFGNLFSNNQQVSKPTWDSSGSGSSYSSTPSASLPSQGITPKATGNQSHDDFINMVGGAAVNTYGDTSVLPSLTIAQAILESGWGNSAIGNNMFGIKAGGSWSGATQTVNTKEHGANGWYTTQAAFRDYASVEDSIKDHGVLLQNQRYSNVRSADNYYDAAHAVHKAGYATDPTYAQKLINIIEQNNLQSFDDKARGNIPGHATGNSYIPRDNYLFYAHKGEAVLPKHEADEWRRDSLWAGGQYNDFGNATRQNTASLTMTNGDLTIHVVVSGSVDGVGAEGNTNLITSLQGSLAGTIPTRLMDYLSFNKETTPR